MTDAHGSMVAINTWGWPPAGEVPLFDDVSLRLDQYRGKRFKMEARVRLERQGKVWAEVNTDDSGALWLAGRLRKGMHLDTSFGKVTLARNGWRPLRSQRCIRIESPRNSWVLRGLSRGFEFRDDSGQTVWLRQGRRELLHPKSSPESLALFGMLAFTKVQGALTTVQFFARY